MGTKTGNAYQTVIGKYNSQKSDQAFVIGWGSDDSNRDNILTVDTKGSLDCKNVKSSNGDYAEYFEWEDSNINNEDRIGYFVSLGSGDNIVLASSEDILGVTSAMASVIGNSQENVWVNKYQKDIYGREIFEEYVDENGNISQRQMLNPDYDPEQVYIPRSERSEWAVVGMLGRLIVRDDGTCVVGKYCTSNNEGIATSSTSGYRVLKRLDESHIQILFK